MRDINPEILELWRADFEREYCIDGAAFNYEAKRYRAVDDKKISSDMAYITNIRFVAWIRSRELFI
jgi:hypothetical protein